ncbi:hypothetical protein GGS20DRAFT_532324 [Poronia punctata]|nr:hypothetical protein GGS20DRAFT_532324 [Poronia punctata]
MRFPYLICTQTTITPTISKSFVSSTRLTWFAVATIMSLYRWSLPTRGLIRDSINQEESSDQHKFPTVHIGQPAPRRKQNLSSTFSALFEKPENRQELADPESSGVATTKSQPLTPRSENVLPIENLTCSDFAGRTNIIPTEVQTFPEPYTGDTHSSVSNNAGISGAEATQPFRPRVSSQSGLQRIETPRLRSFSLSSVGTEDTERRDVILSPKCTEPADRGELEKVRRVRSCSSSYPTEGMRSPISFDHSPEYSPLTKKVIPEYGLSSDHISRLHMASSESSSGTPIPTDHAVFDNGSETPISPDTIADKGHKHPTNDGSQNHVKRSQLIFPHRGRARRLSKAVRDSKKQSTTSDMTVPILASEGSTSSELKVSFVTYKQRRFRSASDDCQWYRLRGSKGITDCRPRSSTNTKGSALAVTDHFDSSNSTDTWSTAREGDMRDNPQPRPTSWAKLFIHPTLNNSSVTLSHRIHRFKVREWVKEVYDRTRARLFLAVRSESALEVKSLSGLTSLERPRLRQSHTKKKTSLKVKKWRAYKAFRKVTKRPKQHIRISDLFTGFPTERKGFPMHQFHRESSESVENDNHDNHSLRKSQSCPAGFGLLEDQEPTELV